MQQQSPVPQPPPKIIELRCTPQKNTLGLVDHYYMVLDGVEYHVDLNSTQKQLPEGTTRRSHTVEYRGACSMCYDRQLGTYFTVADIFKYFPWFNCETICMGFSFQSLFLLTVPFIVALFLSHNYLCCVIFMLLVAIAFLLFSKYNYSRTKYALCPHIELPPEFTSVRSYLETLISDQSKSNYN